MDKKLKSKLLQINERDDFIEYILDNNPDMFHDFSLWDDKEIIDRTLKVCNMTYEELKSSIVPLAPPDYFDDDRSKDTK